MSGQQKKAAKKAITRNTATLNEALSKNEVDFRGVVNDCVDCGIVTEKQQRAFLDTMCRKILQARVQEFVAQVIATVEVLPDFLDDFALILFNAETVQLRNAAEEIAKKCEYKLSKYESAKLEAKLGSVAVSDDSVGSSPIYTNAGNKHAATTNDSSLSTQAKVAPSSPGKVAKSSGQETLDRDHESEETVTSDWPWSKKKKPDEDIVYHYTTNPGRNRGIVLIINNVKFLDKSKDRDSSEEDEEKLKEAFDKYRYEVITVRNLEADAIKDAVKKVVQKGVTGDHDSFICCILSHGNPAGIEGVDLDGKTVTVTELANIVNCDKLHRKPKIFVFQACRGAGMPEPMVSDLAIPPSIREEEEVMVPDGRSIALPPEADFLFAFSTVENNRALRGKYTGSHYITALSNAIINHGPKLSIDRILLVVNHKVAGASKRVEIEKDGKTETCIYHQMPEIRSTLQGYFYFQNN